MQKLDEEPLQYLLLEVVKNLSLMIARPALFSGMDQISA